MGSPIRILHVLGGLDIGGAETFVMNIYRHIDRSQVQFDFVKHTDLPQFFDNEIKSLGGHIYTCPRYKGYNHFKYVNWWKNFFRQHPQYKIIHGHVRSTAAIYLQIAKSFGRTTISHSHSTRNNSGISALVKAVLQYPIRFIADYFFACSKTAGEWLFGKKITKQSNFFVIPNAIDTAKFAYNPTTRQEMRHKLGLENNFVIGHVGRLDIPKNHAFLLQVFAEVYKQNPQARLLLVGDGPLKEDLIKQTEQLKIRQVVLFCGNQPANRYYQAMDVFLFPSIYEGLPLSLVEAQTSGLSCIIADHITQEVDLQKGLLKRINLHKELAIWAQEVLAQMGKPRTSQHMSAAAKGFDIMAAAYWFEKFYFTHC